MAKEKGIYKKYGLDVTILTGGYAHDVKASLKSGEADFGIMFLYTGIMERANGVNIVNIGQIFQRSGIMWVAKKKSNINTLDDFNGKRIGVWRTIAGELTSGFLAKHNIKAEIVPFDKGINVLLKDAVDVTVMMEYNEYKNLLNSGVNSDEITKFNFYDYGMNFPEDGIYCLENTFKKDPELCEKFVKASIEGWAYSIENKEETIKVIDRYKKNALVASNQSHSMWMLNSMKDMLGSSEKKVKEGCLLKSDFDTLSEFLYENKFITNKPLYTDFIKAADNMAKINLKISKPVFYAIIAIFSIALVFVVIELGHIYGDYLWKKNAQDQAEARIKAEVIKIQKIIYAIQEIPQNLAYVLEFSNPKKEHIQLLLNTVVANNDEVFGTCVAFEPNAYYKDSTYYAPYIFKKNGKIQWVNPTDTTNHYFSMDWYLIPKTLNKPIWIEPYYDEGSSGGNIVLATYSVPFYSFDGTNETMKGIIAVDISVDWLSKMVSSIKLFDESYSMLVSENGTIISCPNPQWPYNESLSSLAEENNVPILKEIGRDLQKGKSGFVNVGKFDKKRNWWIYYMPIPANKWGVLLLVPQN